MSRIRPFRAYRPADPEKAKQIASFPYDVVSSAEARELARGNPLSFLHVCKPEIDLDPDASPYDDRVYATGKANLQRLIEDGTLTHEEAPGLYVYQQRMGDHVQAGLVCCCSVREYEQDLIKKHEFTRPEKEDDRTRHVTESAANAEPVFLTYRASKAIDAMVDRVRSRPPVYDFTADDGIGHTVWVMDDRQEIEALVGEFERVPALYVADGHHRTAAAARTGQHFRSLNPGAGDEAAHEYFMAVVFPHDQLQILDYNRVVRDLNGLDTAAFLEKVGEMFEVSPASQPKPSAPRSFGMFLDGNWYALEAKPGTFPEDDPVEGLDVAILQENLLGPVLGIGDPRTDERIDFVGGIRGMEELEKRCREGWAVAFALYPTSLDQLMAVADSSRVMPPKSTWFEPKLRSGLVVRLIEED
jgi:uncharacterized protein (DUF1015 family)